MMNWEDELRTTIRSMKELSKFIDLNQDDIVRLQSVADMHPMRITRYYLSLMNSKDPDDPLRRMVVPSMHEMDISGSYDTSGEAKNTKLPGLQHKYSNTALILATSRCASYCRHCFRKRLVGLSNEEILTRFRSAAAYISNHSEIDNVLISGGDPLVLRTNVISKLLGMISPIRHIKFVRIGTRVPIVFPQRINDDHGLIELFSKYSPAFRHLYVVTQINHPREITAQSVDAISRILKSGALILNQAVLLHKVNDDPVILAELMNKLVSIGVSPYYLFQCRPVKRVKSHFPVPLIKGINIINNSRSILSGPAKRFKFVMSHISGKIEIIGILNGDMVFKYLQFVDQADNCRVFTKHLSEHTAWLDDIIPS